MALVRALLGACVFAYLFACYSRTKSDEAAVALRNTQGVYQVIPVTAEQACTLDLPLDVAPQLLVVARHDTAFTINGDAPGEALVPDGFEATALPLTLNRHLGEPSLSELARGRVSVWDVWDVLLNRLAGGDGRSPDGAPEPTWGKHL